MTDAPKHVSIEELLAQARWLERLARRLVLDPSEADDVVQDTWIAALHARPTSNSVRGWLAGIARKVVLQRGRGESARRQRERSVARPEATEAEVEANERAHAQKRLVDAVLALDEPYRSTVILHYFDHLEVAEVARRLGVSESTIRTRMSRAVSELRERCRRDGGESWALAFLPLVPSAWSSAAKLGAASSSAKAATAASAPWIGGALVALGWKLTVGAALAATLAWFLWPKSSGLDAPRSGDALHSLSAEAQLDRPAPAVELAHAANAEARTPIETPTAATAAPTSELATLDLHVHWGDDGKDAIGIGVSFFLWSAADPFTDCRFARTDSHGRVHVEDLTPGSVAIETDRSDGVQVTLNAGANDALELAIPDGFDLHGLVVDAEERPVADARIWLSQYFNYHTGQEVATSGPDGRFVVRDVGPARYVGARHARLGPSVLELLVPAKPGQQIETRLVLANDSAEITGLVRDEHGEPVAGAQVQIESASRFVRDADGHGRNAEIAPAITRTDEHGRFLVSGVAAQFATVVVRAAGFAPGIRAQRLAPGPTQLEFTLARMAVVHGLVVDAAGAPIGDAFIGCGEYGAVVSAQTRSRADGSFRLVGLPAGSVEVRIDAGAKGHLAQTFQLHAGDDVEWPARIVAKPGVRGRVIDAEGQPASGWMVAAISSGQIGLFLRSSSTDEAGRFELADWPAEADAIEVREAHALRGPPAAIVNDVRPGGGTDVVIRLDADAKRSAKLLGRVVDELGQPVEAAEVIWFCELTNTGFSEATDSAGRFQIGPIRPEHYYLQVRVKGYADGRVNGIALKANENHDVGDVRLARPGDIEVSLRLPAGFDIEQAKGYVAIRGPDNQQRNSILIEAGKGRLGGLEPGHYELTYMSDRMRADRVEVEVVTGQTCQVEFATSPGTTRMVSVELPTGRKNALVRIQARDAAGTLVSNEETTVRADRPILFSIPGLVVGTYTLDASTPDGLSAHATFEVLKLEPVGSIETLTLK
jgi:RNA polymerase sigma factor (sigma-70 family)